MRLAPRGAGQWPDVDGETLVDGLPARTRIRARIRPAPGAGAFGLCVGARTGGDAWELRFDPSRATVEWRRLDPPSDATALSYTLEAVAGLHNPFTLDVILWDGLYDVCIDECRTFIVRLSPPFPPEKISAFANDGSVEFLDIDAHRVS